MIKDNKTLGNQPFQFKSFEIHQDSCAMKIGTDGILLGAWAKADGAKTVLDIGSGTGVIAIMMAQRNAVATIHAVEIEEAAAQQAQFNMNACPWKDRLSVFKTSIQDYAKSTSDRYDLVVSNPPFFSGGTFSADQNRKNVRHTVKLPNGDLLSAARQLMSPDGRFCVILPYLEGLQFVDMAKRYHLFCTKMVEVKSKVDKSVERLLIQFEKQDKPQEIDQLVIQHDARNDYTQAYIDLTGDFYLNM